MKTTTAPLAAAIARQVTRPRYLLRFFEVPLAAGRAEYPFSREFVSGEAPGAPLPTVEALGRPAGNSQTVETEQGRSSIGAFSLPLVDLDGDVLRQLSDPALPLSTPVSVFPDSPIQTAGDVTGYPPRGTLIIENERIRYRERFPATGLFGSITRAVDGTYISAHPAGALLHNGEQLRAGQRAQLLAGYADLDVSEWLRFSKMQVSGLSLQPDGVTFSVQVADIQRFLKRGVFTGATSAAPTILYGDPVTLALRMLLSTGTKAEGAGSVQVTAANTVAGSGTSFLSFFRPGDTVLIDPQTTSEQVATILSVESDLSLTTVEALLATAAGRAFRRAGTGGAYDVFASADSLGVPASLVDVAGLEALRAMFFLSDVFHFRLQSPEEGKTFLEQEVWRACNAYPFVNQAGQYGAKRYPGTTGAPSAALGAADVLSWVWAGGEDKIVNEVEFTYDWNDVALPGEFGTRQRYTALASKAKFGAAPTLKYAFKGIHTAQNGQSILDRRALQLLQRFSDPPPVLQIGVRYADHVLDIGDTVTFTHPGIPNRRTGQRGLDRELFEIRDLRPAFGASGGLVLTLLHTGAVAPIDTPLSGGALAT